MQTFLPYSDFEQSLSCLDNKRLGKQRVESMQILNILTGIFALIFWLVSSVLITSAING